MKHIIIYDLNSVELNNVLNIGLFVNEDHFDGIGRTPASVGGCGFDPQLGHSKAFKNGTNVVTSTTLALRLRLAGVRIIGPVVLVIYPGKGKIFITINCVNESESIFYLVYIKACLFYEYLISQSMLCLVSSRESLSPQS